MNIVALNALAETNRLRILELLRERPHTVGEIANVLRLRQPQATKHLQMLEKAGLVLMYPQGQRRVYALQAEPLQEIYAWVGAFKPDWLNPPCMLHEYTDALKREEALAAGNSSWADGRSVTISRVLTASPAVLWRFWTEATAMKQWWSPEYLTTRRVESDPRPGGTLRVDMEQSDGSIHTADGHYTQLREPERLEFMMCPLDAAGKPLFESHNAVKFEAVDTTRTRLTQNIRLAASTSAAVRYIAGLEIGWNQTLDKLEHALAATKEGETRM